MNFFKCFVCLLFVCTTNFYAMEQDEHQEYKESEKYKEEAVLLHIASDLFDRNIITLEQDEKKAREKGPVGIHTNMLQQQPALISACVDNILDMYKHDEKRDKELFNVDHICAVRQSAVAFASVLAKRLNKSFLGFFLLFQENNKKEEYAIGRCNPKETCLLVDDCITSGGQDIFMAKQLEEKGMAVKKKIFCFIDAHLVKTCIEKSGYSIESVLTLQDIVAAGCSLEKISQEQYDACMHWIRMHEEHYDDL